MTNLIDYLEFPARDLAATKAFFEQAFAWQFEAYGPDYTAFSGGGLSGGFYRSELRSTEASGGALLVFLSDDLALSQQTVIAAGGIIVKEIFEFPGGQRFQFAEPSGNEMGVWSKV